MAVGSVSGFEVYSFENLTAAGVTGAIDTVGNSMTFQVDVTGIGTNVVIRPEASLDGVNYFALRDATNNDFTITANGTYGYAMVGPVHWVRMRLVSFSGGTPVVATKVGAA